jgi:hypothetical protein
MPKSLFRLVALALLTLPLMLGGCNIFLQANQSIPTSTLSLLSKTASPMAQTSILETATMSLEKTTLPLCDKVPKPQLIWPKDGSNTIYLSGTFYLCWYTEDSFDMDSGALGHTDPSGNMDTTLTDIELRVRASTLDGSINYFIMGVNGAYITNSDMETIENCQNGIFTPPPDSGIIFGMAGVSACVLTNEGRLGYIKVESVNPIGTEGLEISFITWNKK